MVGTLIGDTLRRSAKRFPDKTAIVCEDVRITYRLFDEQADRLANALGAMGVRKGDRIAILARNCHQYPIAYFAASRTGGLFVPLNFTFSAEELRYTLGDAAPKVLILGEDLLEHFHWLRDEIPSIEHFIGLGGNVPGGVHHWNDLMAAHPPHAPQVTIDEDDEYCLQYTGGTTGRPKGVVLTHRARLHMALLSAAEYHGVEEDAVFIIGTPFFHMGTLHLKMQPLVLLGGTAVIMRRFDPREYLELVGREKVTHISGVPTQLYSLLQLSDLDRYDLSSVRRYLYGGSSMPSKLLDEGMARMPGVRFVQGYGSTEAGQITVLSHDDHFRKPGCTGRPLLTVDLRVVDREGHDVKPGEVGEVLTRGPQVMSRYWNRPDLTGERLKDGWLHTGDIAHIDDDGYITLVDRKDDMIVSGGENVFPGEVEAALLTSPVVAEAAVFGVPDEKWVEAVRAAVVLKPGAEVSEQHLIDYCRTRIASYKKPRGITFVDAIPRTPVGKPDRRAARSQYLAGLAKARVPTE